MWARRLPPRSLTAEGPRADPDRPDLLYQCPKPSGPSGPSEAYSRPSAACEGSPVDPVGASLPAACAALGIPPAHQRASGPARATWDRDSGLIGLGKRQYPRPLTYSARSTHFCCVPKWPLPSSALSGCRIDAWVHRGCQDGGFPTRSGGFLILSVDKNWVWWSSGFFGGLDL